MVGAEASNSWFRSSKPEGRRRKVPVVIIATGPQQGFLGVGGGEGGVGGRVNHGPKLGGGRGWRQQQILLLSPMLPPEPKKPAIGLLGSVATIAGTDPS